MRVFVCWGSMMKWRYDNEILNALIFIPFNESVHYISSLEREFILFYWQKTKNLGTKITSAPRNTQKDPRKKNKNIIKEKYILKNWKVDLQV